MKALKVLCSLGQADPIDWFRKGKGMFSEIRLRTFQLLKHSGNAAMRMEVRPVSPQEVMGKTCTKPLPPRTTRPAWPACAGTTLTVLSGSDTEVLLMRDYHVLKQD